MKVAYHCPTKAMVYAIQLAVLWLSLFGSWSNTVWSFKVNNGSGRLGPTASKSVVRRISDILNSHVPSSELFGTANVIQNATYRSTTRLEAHDGDIGNYGMEGDGDLVRGHYRTSRYLSRGDRRRAGKLLRKHQLSQPTNDPWLTEDFGGIPNLPHRTPIALSQEPVNDEFLEMRKRQIPHSLLKNYYMHRHESHEEISGFDDEFKPILSRSPKDRYLYLLGEGVVPEYKDYLGEDGNGNDGFEASFDDIPSDTSKEALEKHDGSFAAPHDLNNNQYLRKARRLVNSYDGKDAVCQLLLSSIKEYQDANLRAMTHEEPPMDSDIIEPEMDDFFVMDSQGFPLWLKRWNDEYLRGREGLEGAVREEYDRMWYERVEWLMYRYDSLINNDGLLNRFRAEYEHSYEKMNLKQQIMKAIHGDPSNVGLGDMEINTAWSEHIPTFVFETMARYALSKHGGLVGDEKQKMLDLRADIFKSCIHMSMNRRLRERALKEEEENRLKYIDFLHKRRKVLNSDRYGPQPNTPYWLWQECWKRRETIVPDTMLEILKSIRAVDPNVDLKQLIKGTVEHMKSPKLHGTKFDLQMVFDDTLSDHVAPIEELTSMSPTDNDKDSAASSNSSSVAETTKDEKQVANESTTISSDEMGDIPMPKPLGYYFKDVLSFDKFEEEFKKFNVQSFGTEEFGVRVGQLVKGTIEIVRPNHVLVDIHTSKLATMMLSDYFETSKDVPTGGFDAIFKEGDELYFEILSKYNNNIRLSMRRIKAMYKCRDVYRKYFKHEVMKVRVLQRYTQGVLVQYQGEDVEDIPNYKCPTYVSNLDNIAFVPYKELDKRYRSQIQHIKLDIVGKVIPVYMPEFVACNGVPLVSNVEALRRLLLPHIKPGDVIVASPCMYGKESTWYYLGHTIGILSISDMREKDYEKHKMGDLQRTRTVVKSVDYLSGTVELSTMLLEESHRNAQYNECLTRLKEDPDVIATFNTAVKETEPISTIKSAGDKIDPDLNTHHNVHRVPTMKITTASLPNLPVTLCEKGKRTWDAIHWDVASAEFPENSCVDENDAYHNYKWEVLTESGWSEVSPAERRVLNRAHYQHDEVVYYQHENRNYRADLVEMVRQNLTEYMEQPLRNNCFRPDDDDAHDINALQDIDLGGGTF